MTQVVLHLDDLPSELRKRIQALGPDDELVIEQDGVVITRLQASNLPGGGLRAFLESRRGAEPLDAAFVSVVAEAVAAGNRPDPD